MFKNKKNLANIVSTVILFILLFPAVMFADNPYTPLIQCGNSPHAVTVGSSTKIVGLCTFNDFIATVNRIINWIISIAGVVFAISAIRGGFMYMTAGADEGNIKKAREILTNTIWGFIIILIAWVAVYTILKIFVRSPETNTIFNFMSRVN